MYVLKVKRIQKKRKKMKKRILAVVMCVLFMTALAFASPPINQNNRTNKANEEMLTTTATAAIESTLPTNTADSAMMTASTWFEISTSAYSYSMSNEKSETTPAAVAATKSRCNDITETTSLLTATTATPNNATTTPLKFG